MGKMENSNLCLIDMKHDLNLTLKMCKVVLSGKQITEIKKEVHTDPIYTYSDSGINKDSNSTVDPCGSLTYFISTFFYFR